MANSADLDQLEPTDLDPHFFQRQSISGFSRIRVTEFRQLIGSFVFVVCKVYCLP